MQSDLNINLIRLVLVYFVTNSSANSSKPAAEDGAFDGVAYLSQFGYMDDVTTNKNLHLDTISISIREFQKFNGLPVTGKLDKTTTEKMKQPRCGMPDIDKSKTQSSPLKYSLTGDKWRKRDLTYKFVSYTRKLGGQQQLMAVSNALKKWSDVTNLTFRPQSGEVDIEIGFYRREHGDGRANSFDGIGGTLAHAFFPGNSAISGDAHFDDDEDWTMGTDKGTNFEIVAAHEFGHSLGLQHSSNPKALMAPFYQGYTPNYSLHADDIQGIQALYGYRPNPPRTTPRPTQRPTPRPTPRPTQRPTPRIIPRPRQPPAKPRGERSPQMTNKERTTTAGYDGDHCSLTFNAIEQVHDGTILAFKGAHVYRLNERGPIQTLGLIKNVFQGAPQSPDAVVYDGRRRQLFIFKAKTYWRYTGYRLDAGYPRSLPTAFQGISAAVQTDGAIFLFKGNKFTQWTETWSSLPEGFPRNSAEYWTNLPADVKAAFRSSTGDYFFFKGQRFWRYSSQGVLFPGYPADVRPYWLNCQRPSRHTLKTPA